MKTKTLIMIAVIMVAIIGIADQVEFWRNQAERSTSLETRASLVGAIQADALAQPLWDISDDQTQAILVALERDPDFLSAEVVNADKKRVAAHGKLDTQTGYIEKTFDIEYGGSRNKKNLGQLIFRLSTERLAQAQQDALRAGFIKLLALLAIIMGAIYLALLMITAPLGRMTVVMTQLADGHTAIDVPGTSRTDEIGAMAHAVNIFKVNVIARARLEAEQAEIESRLEQERQQAMNRLAGDFEGTVKSVVQTVSAASGDLEQTAAMMAASAETARDKVLAAIKASGRATANVQTVAAAAEELTASIQEIGNRVAQSAAIANQAVEDANRTNTSVEGLAEAADRIGDVVALINTIASQTNLLALNATIEAARAGEAGKGFAVVASEVKNLANQTAKATEEITTQVMAIQGATATSVKAIRDIGKTITEIDQIASAIAAAVQQQSAATQEIARNVQAAADGTQKVAENIGGVGDAVQQTGMAADIVRDASVTLNQQFWRLNEEVDGFTRRVCTG
ncbi:HAMP domain-containing methyl-accepting chemotaxis protein [Azospirillum sp. TSO22-1]|uniref:methyl-accepting chemotaxis protein n=1 Tax=Azospirillum sp. TSO22-1 TaxID=716789 RepID=UPI0013049C16|nr:HAMP domain-containing methyl-accepting chemotaxis protein [Azospirillum sp. TSO22-1]